MLVLFCKDGFRCVIRMVVKDDKAHNCLDPYLNKTVLFVTDCIIRELDCSIRDLQCKETNYSNQVHCLL